MSTKTNLMVLMLAAVSVATAAVTVVPELINGGFDAANEWQGWRYYDTTGSKTAFGWPAGYEGTLRSANYVQTAPALAGEDYGLDRFAVDGCPAVSTGDVVQLGFAAIKYADDASKLSVMIAEYIDNNADGHPDVFAGVQSGPTDNLFDIGLGVWGEYTTAEYTVQGANTNCLNILFQYRNASGALVAGNYGIDSVQFVPEPATMAMLGLGAIGMIKRRKA
ncbi:PEP-CTERM motif protein [Limihaloglobus sulfuriphilus]|uniref:PEP-CTERM motif protein n=1 Tax=Limihaloglobus sulfuriphilus TaxID=1851148 RepID=A0A1Q2MJD4_9BACT|nr:PEP-CTERM sorting domain-containing protein [Limihaloglobus sulfuriphilus]AQQ72587.1 PEP-CTERM motif protein [Limihaloglobus sulfuriphilus]